MITLYYTIEYSQFSLLDNKVFKTIQLDGNVSIITNKDGAPIVGRNEYIIDVNAFNNKLYYSLPTINLRREHDLQYLARITNYGYKVPPYIYLSNKLLYYTGYLDTNKKYLIKSFYQARTIGQLKVTAEDLNKLDVDAHNDALSIEDFNNTHNTVFKNNFSTKEKKILRNSITTGSFYISEIINFTNEFRVLYFLGSNSSKAIVKLRENYGVLNKDKAVNREITHSEAADLGLTDKIFKELYALGDKLGFCMLSFDIYVKEDGSWGLFEYSTQFGIYYSNKTLAKIKKDMTKAMLLAIKQANKKDIKENK